jgi:hypothetical protein
MVLTDLFAYLCKRPFLLVIYALVLSLVFVPVFSVSAATFNPGCSVSQLTADLATAGSNGQKDTINLASGCTYTLTATLTINADGGNVLTINGNGATISGNNAVQVLNIAPGGANVSINSVTLTAGSNSFAGGIYNNQGTVTLDNSTVSGNTGDYGGGIVNVGTLTLNSSTVSNNSAGVDAGGIYSALGTTLTLNNSTVSGNSAGLNGGGVYVTESTLTLNNSTISGNNASIGGGIHNGQSTSTLNNSTVSGNNASIGGGIDNVFGALALNNSIIANSTDGGDCSINNSSVAAAFSLIEDGSCGIVNGNNGNRTGDPGLGALTGNPAYHPLNAGSVAINAGNNALIPGGITTDQAGSPRIVSGVVDMGSFEYVPPPTSTPTNTPTFTFTPHPSLTPPAPDTNLITNGTFDAGLSGWSFYDSTQQVSGGVLTIAPTAAGGGFYQSINANSAGGTYQVTFRAGNTSDAVKTINLIVRASSYNPSYNCVFVLPAFSPFQNYRMRFNTSPNAFIPMMVQFALSGDATIGVQIDDVTLIRRTNILISSTECVVAPPASTNLVYDGAFNQPVTNNWAAFNATMNSVNIGGANGNIMQIGRNSGTPSGGFYQFNPYSAPANGVLQFDFQMGNQSNVARVINMLVRNPDWTDLHSCFINLPPNTPLTNFQIMLKTTQAWTNIVIQGWIYVGDYVSGTPPFMFDNLSIQYLPTSGFAGSTQCPFVPPMPQRPTLIPSVTNTLAATATASLTATVTASPTASSTETAMPSATVTATLTETPTDVLTVEPPTLTPEPPSATPEPPTAIPTDVPTAEPPTLTPEPPTEMPTLEPPEVTQSP